MTFPLRNIMSLPALLVVAGLFSVAFASAASAASDPVYRLAGADRIGTAIAISQDLYPSGNAGAVVLATSENFPDALAATPLAFAKDAPILMTPHGRLDSRIAGEMGRILAKGKTVFVLGGTAALSDAVVTQVKALGYVADRLGGATRYETALMIAQKFSDPQVIFLAMGTDFGSPLLAGPVAAVQNGVLLLTNLDQMPAATKSYIQAHAGVKRYAVDQYAAKADPSATPVDDGGDTTHLAVLMAKKFFFDSHQVAVATTASYADSLAAGPHAARHNMPLLYTSSTVLGRMTGQYLEQQVNMFDSGYVYGGTAAISDGVKDAVQKFITTG